MSDTLIACLGETEDGINTGQAPVEPVDQAGFDEGLGQLRQLSELVSLRREELK